jgi:Ferritin-like domain
MTIERVRVFLAHAVRLEAAAASRFDELADAMETWGNREVEAFFRRMAEFSRLHLAEAMARGDFRHVSELPPAEYEFPDIEAPECAQWTGVDGMMGVDDALQVALESERAGLAFYQSVATRTHDPVVKRMAEMFAQEERGHVEQLEHWIERQAGQSGDKE